MQGEGVSIMNHTVAFQGWQQCTRDRGALIRRDPKCFSNTNLLPHRNCQGHKSRLKQRHLCWRTPRFFLASLKRKLLYHVRGPHIPNCKVLQWLIGGGKRERWQKLQWGRGSINWIIEKPTKSFEKDCHEAGRNVDWLVTRIYSCITEYGFGNYYDLAIWSKVTEKIIPSEFPFSFSFIRENAGSYWLTVNMLLCYDKS